MMVSRNFRSFSDLIESMKDQWIRIVGLRKISRILRNFISILTELNCELGVFNFSTSVTAAGSSTHTRSFRLAMLILTPHPFIFATSFFISFSISNGRLNRQRLYFLWTLRKFFSLLRVIPPLDFTFSELDKKKTRTQNNVKMRARENHLKSFTANKNGRWYNSVWHTSFLETWIIIFRAFLFVIVTEHKKHHLFWWLEK